MKSHLLQPVHAFKAYAKKVASERSFPVIRDYHEKRYRIIAGLFCLDFEHDIGWSSLAESYNRAAYYNPSGGVLLGTDGFNFLPGFPAAVRKLRRHAAAMRRIYAGLAVERVLKEFPELVSRRVSAHRLSQLAALGKPPDETDECIKFMESDEEIPIDDDVEPETMDELKRAEENRIRHEQHLRQEKEAVIARALAAGIGTAETVQQLLYDMEVEEFLRLTEGLARVSRVDFKPGLSE